MFTSDGTQYSISLLNRWRGDRGYTYSARIQLRHQTSGSALDARINTIVHSPQNVCLPETDLWASWYTDMPAGSGLYASLSVRQNDAKGSFAGAYPAQAGIDRIVVRRVGSGAFVGFAGEAALSGPVDVALGVKLAVLPKEGSVFAAPVFSGQGDVEYRRDATLAKGNVMVYSPLLVVGDGATATVTGAAAFPTNGIVSVLNGGLLVEKAGTSMGWGGGISAGYHEIRVGRGGEVRIDKSQRGGFYNGRTEVTVDGGGTVWLGHDREHSDAAAAGWNTACTYSPYLTLSGGSRVRGPFANWGNNNGQRWTVAGGKADAAVIDAIGAVSYKQQAFTINVADVTGDAAADCVVSGEIPMFEASSANFRYYPTTKFGDGTLRIDGKWAMRGTVTVEAGAVVFGDQGGPFPAGAESALRTSVAGKREFVLKNGSALGKTAGALELDALAVTGGARLALGDGATMSFADSSAKAWTGTLVVEGFREGAVRFGTSGDGLSPEQVELIRTDAGRRVEISTSGYLVYPGFVMVVK